MSPPPFIDAVYTWVDGSDPLYLESARRFSKTPRDLNPERFRDLYDALRHSLRSLELHAPWLRRIYLFTRRPQVPPWLRTDHPRIRIVHHDEVIRVPEALPTFNSNVIEAFLHLLPDISEQFIYFNDDYFLGAPVTPADFYSPDGRMRLFGTFVGERFRHRVYERQTPSFGFLEHAPRLIDRDTWGAMQAVERGVFESLYTRRFRSPGDVRPDRYNTWYLLTHARQRVSVEPFWNFLRHASFLKIKNRPATLARRFAGLRRHPPKFFCLNDDQGAVPDPRALALVRELLADLYPRPSSFERGDEPGIREDRRVPVS